MITAATSPGASACSIASRSLNGTWLNSSGRSARNSRANRSSPHPTASPVCPWYALATETTRRRRVACLADLSAMSIASPPPLPYITLAMPSGAVATSACASAVRATEGKWWLPMSK